MQKKSEKKETETIAIRSEVRTISKSYILFFIIKNDASKLITIHAVLK